MLSHYQLAMAAAGCNPNLAAWDAETDGAANALCFLSCFLKQIVTKNIQERFLPSSLLPWLLKKLRDEL